MLGASSTASANSPILIDWKNAGAGERGRGVRRRETRILRIAGDASPVALHWHPHRVRLKEAGQTIGALALEDNKGAAIQVLHDM